MLRHSLLGRARLGVTLGLLIAAASLPVRGQDLSNDERLDRIERDLSMLQRQVYRGAPAPLASGDAAGAVGAEVRMDRLETEMRDLTGRIEELANQVDRLHQRVEQVNSDVDTRFGQMGQGPLPDPTGAGRPALAGAFPPALPSAGPLPRGAIVPPPVTGTLTPPGTPASAPPATPELAAAPGTLPGGSATDQYNYAFGLLKQANYAGAEAALRSFVQQHPKSPMAGNAQYWLGETFYARNKFIEAAAAFAEGYKRYPKSPKAPDTLLKLGMSLGQAGQKQNACVALAQLDREFPNPGGPIKERATAEKKRLGCG